MTHKKFFTATSQIKKKKKTTESRTIKTMTNRAFFFFIFNETVEKIVGIIKIITFDLDVKENINSQHSRRTRLLL